MSHIASFMASKHSFMRGVHLWSRGTLHRPLVQGGGKKKFYDALWDFFSGGDPPPPRMGGVRKKWVLRKKVFLPMLHVPHIITVFPPHNMPLLLAGIPLFGYLGY